MFRSTIYLVIFAFFSACTFVETSSGKNSTPLEALSGKIFHAPLVLRTAFRPHQKKNYYAIDISRAGFYTISISPVKGANLRLSILNNTTHPLAIADDNYQNQGESIHAVFLEKKLYYLAVERQEDTPTTFLDEQESHYSLLVQPFIPIGLVPPFYLDQTPIPSLRKIQLLPANRNIYGFYTPNNNRFLPSPLLEDFVSRIERLENISTAHPYHLALYAFVAPKEPSKASLVLSGVKYTNALMVLSTVSDFSYLLHHDISGQNRPQSLIIANENNSGEAESIQNVPLVANQRYILAIIGFNMEEQPSVLKSKTHKYYQISLKINKSL